VKRGERLEEKSKNSSWEGEQWIFSTGEGGRTKRMRIGIRE
jgi:hypothetical protein